MRFWVPDHFRVRVAHACGSGMTMLFNHQGLFAGHQSSRLGGLMLPDQRAHGFAEAAPHDEAIDRFQCVVLYGKI